MEGRDVSCNVWLIGEKLATHNRHSWFENKITKKQRKPKQHF